MVPTHWNASIDGGWLERFQKKGARIHRLDGLHGMVHLRPQLRPKQVATIPKIAVRRLLGDGVHDAGNEDNLSRRHTAKYVHSSTSEVDHHALKLHALKL